MAEHPIPGDPEALRGLARRLQGGHNTLTEIAGVMGEFQSDAAWEGDAADEFREKAGDFPDKMRMAAERFTKTAQALTPYADVLEEAKRTGGQGTTELEGAERDRSAAEQNLDQVRSSDTTGDATGQAQAALDRADEAVNAARDKINRAKQMVEDAADTCATRIGDAIDDGLKDEGGGFLGLGGLARGIRNFVEDNRGLLSVASDVLGIAGAILGVASIFFPPLAPLALAVGAAAFLVDAALFMDGSKSLGDLGLSALGLVGGGVGRIFGRAARGAQAARGLGTARAGVEAAEAGVATAGRGLARARSVASSAANQASRVRGLRGDSLRGVYQWSENGYRYGGAAARSRIAGRFDDVAEAAGGRIPGLERGLADAQQGLGRAQAQLADAATDAGRFGVDASTDVGRLGVPRSGGYYRRALTGTGDEWRSTVTGDAFTDGLANARQFGGNLIGRGGGPAQAGAIADVGSSGIGVYQGADAVGNLYQRFNPPPVVAVQPAPVPVS
ncbi:MAG: putative T7SS-secreted protein [Acidimicrobiales bacterium]